MSIEQLKAELKADLVNIDEGLVLRAYDDETAALLKPGYMLIGNATIGVGRNLTGKGLTRDESMYLLDNDVNETVLELWARIPWISALPTVEQKILCNMAFNMGTARLMGFTQMLAALRAGNRERAAKEMLASKWANQVPKRAARLQRLLLKQAQA